MLAVLAVILTGGVYPRTRDHEARQSGEIRARIPEHEFRRPPDDGGLLSARRSRLAERTAERDPVSHMRGMRLGRSCSRELRTEVVRNLVPAEV